MKNQSIKTLAFLGGLLLVTAPAKADERTVQSVFWYAYTLGAGTSLCEAEATMPKMVLKGLASEIVQALVQGSEKDPDLTPFKQSFLKAYQELKEDYPDCIE